MSVKVMSLVWDNFDRGGSEKLAMLALADWCNDTGGSLYPSISSIAKKINVSDQRARTIMHKFISEGYLSVIANHNGGNPGQTRHYILNVKKLLTPIVEDTPIAHDTPIAGNRDPYRGQALPLSPTIANPSLTINDPLKDKRLSPTAPKFILPDWINRDDWNLWLQTRKGKKMIHGQMQKQVDKLAAWRIKGLDHAKALSDAAANGYQGLFEPKSDGQKNETSSKPRKPNQDNFSARDYGQGIQDL